MPKVERQSQIVKDTESEEQVHRLASVLWKNGDISTPACQQALVEAGFLEGSLSPAMVHRAEEINDERLRETFRATNADPSSRLRIVVHGDHEFDPNLNPKHPARGPATLVLEPDLPETYKVKAPKATTKPKPQSIQKKGRRVKYNLFGYPALSVFRWMGLHGWTIKEAEKIMEHYEIGCSRRSVEIHLWFGSKGQQGPPADLSEDEVEEINRIAGR